jgi:class 3 adenylate cyclase
MASVFFTGHMIDRPGRASPRFPPSLVPQIAQRIASELDAVGISDGFASGVCGGDLLFLEATLARGARAHLILPCAVEEFRADCVDVIPGADWGARFDRIVQQATTLEILGDQYASDNATASECCSRIMMGLARRCAAEQGGQALVLALWDGRPGDAVGGTHSAVQFALQQGLPVRWMKDLAPGGSADTTELKPLAGGTSSAIRHAGATAEAPQSICAAVFADAVGFSKLREREVPAFSRHYLSCAMQALQTQTIVPLVKNTWGDGLYLVFDSVRDAGRFALDFRDRIVSTNWAQLGLEHVSSVRIAAHAGPMYRIYDPVLGQWSYTGAHVTRAARLEPSTEPGRVFVSVAFAALAAAEGVSEFSCRAVGRRQLAKNFGEIAVYELVSAGASADGELSAAGETD